MQERMQISKMDLNTVIGNLRKAGRYSDQQIQLIQDDLLYGLSKEETERYTQKSYDFKQMQVYSRCLRNNYSEEVIAVITEDGLSGSQMEVALEFYEKGIPVETISKVAAGDMTAANMKRAYQRVLDEMDKAARESDTDSSYAQELMEQINSVVSKLEFQEQRYDALNQKLKEIETVKKDSEVEIQLRKELSEKDKLLIEQQNRLNDAHVASAKLRNELEVLRKENDEMQTVVNGYQKKEQQNENMEEQEEQEEQDNKIPSLSEVKNVTEVQKKECSKVVVEKERVKQRMESVPIYYGMPIGYSIALVDGNTVMIPAALVEKTIKKTSALLGIFSKLMLKKKSRQDLIKLIAAKELTPEQLFQIRSAIEKGLTEGQLLEIIRNKITAEQMKEIIEIAVLENSMGE